MYKTLIQSNPKKLLWGTSISYFFIGERLTLTIIIVSNDVTSLVLYSIWLKNHDCIMYVLEFIICVLIYQWIKILYMLCWSNLTFFNIHLDEFASPLILYSCTLQLCAFSITHCSKLTFLILHSYPNLFKSEWPPKWPSYG